MKVALLSVVSIICFATSAIAAPIITLTPLPDVQGLNSDSQSAMISSGIVNLQYATSPQEGAVAARIVTSATIDKVTMTYSQVDYYTYDVDVTITGRDVPSLRSASQQKQDFSKVYGTPVLFSGALRLDHINDSMGNLDVALVDLRIGLGLVDAATASISRDPNGQLTANYHFDMRGGASLVTSETFTLTPVPEPGAAVFSVMAAAGMLLRRRR